MGSKRAGEELWTKTWNNSTKENGFPLSEGRDRWDTGKKFFPVRVVKR